MRQAGTVGVKVGMLVGVGVWVTCAVTMGCQVGVAACGWKAVRVGCMISSSMGGFSTGACCPTQPASRINAMATSQYCRFMSLIVHQMGSLFITRRRMDENKANAILLIDSLPRPVYTIPLPGCGADGSALRLGRRGRRFKSGHPDHF